MTAFTLKSIALSSMIIDHSALVFPLHFPVEFRAVGRLAWPIFAYLLAESFRHTKSSDKLMLRLGLLAIISQIPYSLAITQSISFISNTNIFYTLFLGGAAIMIYNSQKEKKQNLLTYIIAVFPTALSAELLSSDYGGIGVLFIFCMYAITEKKRRLIALGFFALLQFLPMFSLAISASTANASYRFEIGTEHILAISFALSTIILIAKYNGKRGINAKWLFYTAYPLHLSALAVASIVIN